MLIDPYLPHAVFGGDPTKPGFFFGTAVHDTSQVNLGFFLSAAIATGVLLLRRKPLAYTLAPSLMAFLVLTGVPILLTPVV
jgi:uncharacterized membrane protein YadS